jgi:hypothetical protein
MLNNLWRSYVIEMKPSTPQDITRYSESLKRLNDLSDTRRLRINTSRDTVPYVLWALLIGGGVMTVAFTFFFGVSDVRAQFLMVAALTAEIAVHPVACRRSRQSIQGRYCRESGPNPGAVRSYWRKDSERRILRFYERTKLKHAYSSIVAVALIDCRSRPAGV